MPKQAYDPKIHPTLLKWMARAGLSNEQMAYQLEVSGRTIGRWIKKYPEVGEAVKEGQDYTDAQVEDSLLKKAKGFSYTETEIHDGPRGVVTKEKTKYQVPDTVAIIFWLKNRRPGQWRDVRQVDLDMSNRPVDELMEEAKDIMEMLQLSGEDTE